jgi:hypothetical protein
MTSTCMVSELIAGQDALLIPGTDMAFPVEATHPCSLAENCTIVALPYGRDVHWPSDMEVRVSR